MNSHAPELYLVIDTGPAAEARLAAVLSAVGVVAAVLIRCRGGKLDAQAAKVLVEAAQKADIAALIDADASLARTLRADGVHLPWGTDLRARVEEAREILGSRGTVGVAVDPAADDARHQAMELAEAGADYIGFESGEGQDALLQWWAEIFEVPCVALDVASTAAAAKAAEAGAEFVAISVPAGSSPADAVAQVAAMVAAMTSETPA